MEKGAESFDEWRNLIWHWHYVIEICEINLVSFEFTKSDFF